MFCSKCGKQIPENGICECQQSTPEAPVNQTVTLTQAVKKGYPGQVVVQKLLSKDSAVTIANKNIRYLHIAIAAAALVLILIIGIGFLGSNELVGTWVCTQDYVQSEITFKRNGDYSVISQRENIADFGKYTIDEKKDFYTVTFQSGNTQLFTYRLNELGGVKVLAFKDSDFALIYYKK